MIVLRRRWGLSKPPLGVQLNPGHPLAQGYFAGWLMNEGARPRVGDLGGRYPGAITEPTEVTFAPTDRGVALRCSTFATAVRGVTLASTLSLPVPYTWLARLRIAATGDSYGCLLTDANGAGRGVYLRGAGTNKISYYYSVDHLNTTALTVGRWHDVAITADAAGAVTFYLDALADGTATSGPTFAALEMLNTAGNDTFAGDLLYQHLWGRVLTPAELRWMQTEPYAMLVGPGPARWYSFPAAGDGGGFFWR